MNIEFSERTLEKISEVSPESCEDFKLKPIAFGVGG
jgi:hypothetical protein